MQPIMFVCGIVWLIIPAFMFFFGYKQLKLRNLIRDTPTSKVGNIKEGLTEVYGDVVPMNLQRAPITGTECAYYSYQVQEYRSTGKSHAWVTIDHASSDNEFYIQDETGQAKIRPYSADFKLDPTFSAATNSGGLPPLALGFLQSRNIALTDGFFGFARTLRVMETALVPGKKLYVFGTAVPDPASRTGNMYYVITKGDKPPLLIISDRSEEHVLSKYMLQAGVLMGIAGFLVLIGLFLVVLGFIS